MRYKQEGCGIPCRRVRRRSPAQTVEFDILFWAHRFRHQDVETLLITTGVQRRQPGEREGTAGAKESTAKVTHSPRPLAGRHAAPSSVALKGFSHWSVGSGAGLVSSCRTGGAPHIARSGGSSRLGSIRFQGLFLLFSGYQIEGLTSFRVASSCVYVCGSVSCAPLTPEWLFDPAAE